MSAQKAQLKMDFTIDLSLFCQTIKSNFSTIWDTLNKHNDQIQALRSQLINHEALIQQPKQRKYSRASSRKMNQNFSLNYSEVSINEQDQKGIEKNINLNPEKSQNLVLKQPIRLVNEPKQQSQQKEIGEIQSVNKELVSLTHEQKQKQQGNKKLDQDQDQYLKLIEEKIYEMNGRLQRMQLSTIKQQGTVSKKMNQINNQIQRNIEAIAKREGELKRQQLLIDKLRGELSQFKLKKQAQLMKMASTGNNNSSSNSNNQYISVILDKIQQISNTLPHLLTRQEFDDYKAEMKPIIGRIQRRVNDSVSNEQFSGLVNILTRKKSDFVVGKNSKQGATKVKDLEGKIQIQDQADVATQYRIISLQKIVKQMQTQIQELKNSIALKTEKLNEKNIEAFEKIEGINQEISRSQHKSHQYEQFMKNMNESYNQKFKEMVNQIIEVQQSIQKLNNQMKFYNYTKSESNIAPGPTSNSSMPSFEGIKFVDMENDMNSLKKKVNKVLMKMQSVKEDILTVRQDFMREIDSLKLTLQKKCDWESLKKGMHYFEERVKQISNFVQGFERRMNLPDQNGESTAAKKGWTCLCCDKDIKQYEGKLGEVKFTSIFPTRYQSPRIGGYYKQKETQKQYKQVFLKQNRRLSHSNNNHQSKQELI